MSELQISLLGIGIAVVLAVYAYSWWQQRRVRRKFGATFKHGHEDALYRSLASEISTPEIPAIALFEPALADSRPLLPHATDSVCALLDAATDYIAVISPKIPVGADALAQLWQQRFDFGKNIHICGVNAASGLLEKVIAESPGAYSAFKLAVQLVSRSGAVSEARLADFRDLARMIAAQLQGDVALPDVTQAAARAQELDKFCAAVDQMIGLNILPGGERLLSGGEVARVAGQHELSLQADGSFHLFDFPVQSPALLLAAITRHMHVIEIERKVEQRQQLSGEHHRAAHHRQQQGMHIGQCAIDFLRHAHHCRLHLLRRNNQLGLLQNVVSLLLGQRHFNGHGSATPR